MNGWPQAEAKAGQILDKRQLSRGSGRRGNIVCDRFGVPLVETTEELKEAVRHRWGKPSGGAGNLWLLLVERIIPLFALLKHGLRCRLETCDCSEEGSEETRYPRRT